MLETSSRVHELRLRVRYAETDQMRIVHHVRYIEWLETARVEYLRAAGFRYRDLEERGVFTSVISVSIQYRAPAKYDDMVCVRTRVSLLKHFKIGFAYEILTDDGALLAESEIILGSITRDGKPQPLPEDLLKALQAGSTMGA